MSTAVHPNSPPAKSDGGRADDLASARLDRRTLLLASGAAVLGLGGLALARRAWRDSTSTFVAAGQRYDGTLVQTIRDGLAACDLDTRALRGRRVLLKPNLVEPDRSAPHVTTHPAMVLAAAEVFRGFGAEVVVGEAPGHVRDTEIALLNSGLGEALAGAELRFADLNYEPVRWVKNAGGQSPLAGFHFPQSIVEADLVVSMPKMKTHHWVGITGAMKNLYGTLPGIKYGWPKNVLHFAGIPQTVVDINASLPKTIAIVDGITCMEGDGPIMGSPKEMGLVVIGTNSTAVDATLARMMQVDPRQISYLALAEHRLGPLCPKRIEQRGERWQHHVDPFQILDVPHLRGLRQDQGEKVSHLVPPVMPALPGRCPGLARTMRGTC
ncbi:MAG: DUF362 domain-containing protein [Planctomycetota bacterium]|nr:MAG: DUF362 domain-containing protein [Planctomycetota bacterium]